MRLMKKLEQRYPVRFRQISLPLLAMLFGWCLSASAQGLAEVMQFASEAEAQRLLAAEDQFTQALSPFDVQSRLGDAKGSKEELMRFMVSQARAFNAQEREALQRAAERIDALSAARAWSLNFPDTVFMVKTTGAEEGGAAGYTRGNYIVLKESALAGPIEDLVHLLAHEAFHILSRHNTKLRQKLYQVIGFTVVDPIALGPIEQQRITNPDAPQTDAVINLENRAGEALRCLMLTYTQEDYTGGSFFKYLKVGFLLVDNKNEVVYRQGKAIILGFKEVARSFYGQVGQNTNYLIHPEEILAENFVLALKGEEGNSAWVLEGVDEVLQSN